jgi:hypothetical protein
VTTDDHCNICGTKEIISSLLVEINNNNFVEGIIFAQLFLSLIG